MAVASIEAGVCGVICANVLNAVGIWSVLEEELESDPFSP